MSADAQPFPYVTLLNILHQPLELIDEKALSNACPHQWYNQTLCEVNGSVVRLGVVRGEYHWHKHDEDDEFFYVVEGHLLIDIEGRTFDLQPRQGVVIPRHASSAGAGENGDADGRDEEHRPDGDIVQKQ